MVERYDILTVGNLSRNRYWGESDEVAVRGALCTSTLIRGDGFRLLVDPPVGDADAMAAAIGRRTGLSTADVTHVFVTHAHGDHLAGLANFPGATWWAAAGVAEGINESGGRDKQFQPAPSKLFDAIDVVHTPGHTADHHSLRLDCDGLSVVVAGDAAMTRDFWEARQGFFNSADFDQVARTIDSLAEVADVIIPGHDNWFLVDGLPERK